MSNIEPAWRKKTRPCPFFSQGRCLFADSCNFLHDIKVKSAVDQSLLDATLVKPRASSPIKNVFDPPSLVVNSASPQLVNLASPTHDSSRYSGLLSVLQDVIGPTLTPTAEEDAPSESHKDQSSTVADSQDTTYDDSTLLPGSDSTLVEHNSRDIVGDKCLVPKPLETDVEVVSSDVEELTGDLFIGPVSEHSSPARAVASEELVLPISAEDEEQLMDDFPSYLVDHHAYEVDGAMSYVVEDDVEDQGICERSFEEDEAVKGDVPSAMASQRHSVLSSFTGASLLASPRNSLFEEVISAESPVQPGSGDLLSPVELSARLRPFSIHSLEGLVKRGDSIDSGYADGDSWVGPAPFPRSPPRSARSSIGFAPSHSRRSSLVRHTMQQRRVSYDVRAVRPSPHMTVETIDEGASDDEESDSEENEDAVCSIFGAYDTSPSESQKDVAEDCPSPTLRISAVTTVERISEEHDEPAATNLPATSSSSPYETHGHLYATRESPDAELIGQRSFVSDDNASFKTALSAQPSCEDLSDVSARVSPVKQDSLLSSISGRSTPNTSLQSHEDDLPYSYEEDADDAPSYDCPDVASITEPTGFAERMEDVSEKRWSEENLLRFVRLSGSKVAEELPPLSPQIAGARPSEQTSGEAIADISFEDCSFSNTDSDVRETGASVIQEGDTYVSEESVSSQDDPDSFDSEYQSFSAASPLQFPLPPTFLPTDFVGHSSLCQDEHPPAKSPSNKSEPAEDVTHTWSPPIPRDESQRGRSVSELTVKADPRTPAVAPSEPASPVVEFIVQRSRAASDLTVKGKSVSSPPPVPDEVPSSPMCPMGPSGEDPARSDSVQSLYDHYMDDESSYDDSSSSGSDHRDMTVPHSLTPVEEPRSESQASRPHSRGSLVIEPQQLSSSFSQEDLIVQSDSDSPRSQTALLPLFTGRKSLLDSPLSELVPKSNPVQRGRSISASISSATRLQTKEIGSTMVPFGFRRYHPQFAARQSLRAASQPLQGVPSQPEFQDALRIRTDITEHLSPPRCFSAAPAPSTDQLLSPSPSLSQPQPQSAPPTSGLKPLRLSSVLHTKRSSLLSSHSSSITSSIVSPDHIFNASTPQSPSVSSSTSLSRNSLLSSTCQPPIPEHIRNTLTTSDQNSPIVSAAEHSRFPAQIQSTRDSHSISTPIQQSKSWRLSHYRAGSRNYTPADATRRVSRRTSARSLSYVVDEEEEPEDDDPTVSRPIQANHDEDYTPRPASALAAPVHAIATPKPTLLFAIASDDVEQVRQVLDSGEAGPNDPVGPQSALAFTLTNDKLAHKNEIVKTLLAYGANPAALRNPALNPAARQDADEEPSGPPPETTLEGMDPATRYFVTRADAAHTRQTSQLIYRSFFRPLTRVRYDVVGQDWALEQLFRVLSMHSQKVAIAPIVVLLCGPSGHGKSLLARKFGSLLDVPTHTVNMTTLRSTHDIWQSYSMSPYEEPSSCTLAQFLLDNEGQRCVVVLDEIEKVEDQKALWSLLMPWELGRCSLEAGKRHVDVRNVIWLGTSNIGHEAVFEHHQNRAEPEKKMTREEYLELTDILRPRVSHCLGASLLSRVTAVLPFVPFTLEERKAIAAEAVYTLAGEAAKAMSPQDVESLVMKALPAYHPGEGARSLHRAVSNQLVDAI